jgi:uncharacterized membrane protein YqjE
MADGSPSVMDRLLRLAWSQPQLLAGHAEAYAELASAEFGEAAGSLKRQALLAAAGLCGLAVAAVLGGVALMLWAVTPPLQIHAAWALFVSPLIPAAAGLLCLLLARQAGQAASFATLRRQLQADMALLREPPGPTAAP